MKTPYLHTPLKLLSKEQIIKIVDDAFEWVKQNYTHIENLKLKVVSTRRQDIWGEYDYSKSTIFVYYNNINDVKQLLNVFLHEFRHSQLNEQRFYILSEKFSYIKNPHEIAARKFAKEHTLDCWSGIK